ncbi:MAG TPA: PIN domain-containing protein [Sphingomicrobium sp.]|nr:PIN domain-containing protein [Sphingomicrobium sp.]
MKWQIDTNVAIHLRDGDEAIETRIARLPTQPVLSSVTRVELEGGVYRDPALTLILRPRVDLLLEELEELPFTASEAAVYGGIVEQCGYSRAKLVDRMIAATAIVASATLITLNPRDFRDIPGLAIEDWS